MVRNLFAQTRLVGLLATAIALLLLLASTAAALAFAIVPRRS